jgi:mannose-6-phosphate isomerase-like protein (cupin superfamily)
VLSGHAEIEIEGESREVKAGSVVYVKSHADHRFYNIEQELKSTRFLLGGRSLVRERFA